MKKYLVTQIIVTKKEILTNGNNHTSNINVDMIVRVVESLTKEGAVGKFVLNTQNIKAEQKLDVQCDELDDILTIS